MSALLHLGEAEHQLLNADADIRHVTMGASNASLARALQQLTEARAAIGAVRLALRTEALFETLDYHETMALRTREAARLARMVPGRGLHLQADQHEARARALRVLIGAGWPVALPETRDQGPETKDHGGAA